MTDKPDTLVDVSAKPGPSQGETQAQTDPQTAESDLKDDEYEFYVLASLPYLPSTYMDCCTAARIEIWPDLGASDLIRQVEGRDRPLARGGPDTHVIVRHVHRAGCEVLRIVP